MVAIGRLGCVLNVWDADGCARIADSMSFHIVSCGGVVVPTVTFEKLNNS